MPRPDRRRLQAPTPPSDTLGDLWGYLGRAERTLGLLGGTLVGGALNQLLDPGDKTFVGQWLPDWSEVPEAFSAFEEHRRKGDWDAAITAAQEELDAGKYFWGLSEGLTTAFVPTGGPALAGAKLLRAAPKLAQTLGKIAPTAVQPGVTSGIRTGLELTGKGLRAPWEAEEWVGRQAVRPFTAGWRALRGTPPPTAKLAETLDGIPSVIEEPVPSVVQEQQVIPDDFETPVENLIPSVGDATTGRVRLYHGSSNTFEAFDLGKANERSLYGPGVYLTADPKIASGYARTSPSPGVEGAPNIQPVTVRLNKVLDIDAPADKELLEGLQKDWSEYLEDPPYWAEGQISEEAFDLLEGKISNPTNKQLYRMMTEFSDPNYPKTGANDLLSHHGFDGITHIGGGITGRPSHRVVIAIGDQFNKVDEVITPAMGRMPIDPTEAPTVQPEPLPIGRDPYEAGILSGRPATFKERGAKVRELSMPIRGGREQRETLTTTRGGLKQLIKEHKKLRQDFHMAAKKVSQGSAGLRKRELPRGLLAARDKEDQIIKQLQEQLAEIPEVQPWITPLTKAEKQAAGIARREPGIYQEELSRAMNNEINVGNLRDEAEYLDLKRHSPKIDYFDIEAKAQTATQERMRKMRVKAGPEEEPLGFIGPKRPAVIPDALPELQDIDEAITISQIPDVGRKIANLPGLRSLLGPLNRSAVANRPELKGLVGREILLVEAQQKAQTVMARLWRMGTFNNVFGKVDPDTGLISEGFLTSAAPNDIRTYPDNIVINGRKVGLNQLQRDWVNVARSIEEMKLVYLKNNGFRPKELSFDQGGSYAGRRVYAKVDPQGNVIATESFSSSSRPGLKGSSTSFEGERLFKSQKEALDHGFKYLSEEETLYLNVQAAYNKVTNQRFLEWMERAIPESLPKGVTGLTLRRVSKEGIRRREFGAEFAGEYLPNRVFGFQGADVAGRVREAEDALKASLDPDLSRALGMVNQVNAVGRFFTLAGDMSPGGIQLLTMAMAHPAKYGKAMGGFVKALRDEKFHARYMDDNAEFLNRHRGMLTSLQGNEMTEAFERGGLIHAKWLSPYRATLTPFQRGFNASMDVAGVELAKGFEHLAKNADGTFDAVKLSQLDSYINEVRGMASSQRLGVTGKVRQWETALMLAPRYNRGITSYLWDVIQGTVRTVPGMGEQTIRTRMARDGMVRTIGGFMALNVGITTALYMHKTDMDKWDDGEALDEIREHLKPTSPRFFTWDIGGRNIGPGSKIRSVIQLFARSAADPSLFNPFNYDDEGGLYRWAMKNPAIKFLRGSAAPVVSSATDILSGHTYIGEPTMQEIDNMESWKNTLSNVLLPDIMPIYLQALLLEGGSLPSRIVGAGAEFFGGRGSPLTRIQLEQEKHRQDPEWRDTSWENVPRNAKIRYRDQVNEEQGGPDYRGPTGAIREEIDTVIQKYMEAMQTAEGNLKDAPFATGHFGEDARKAIYRIEKDMYDELDPLYEKLWPGTREVPEEDTMDYILWQYGQIFEESVLKEDKIDPVTGDVVAPTGEMDYEETDRLLAKLWGSLNAEESDWLLNSIRLREADYPPKIQRMKSATRWLGTVKVDLNGVPTGYWEIGEHPDVRMSLAMQVPELSISDIDKWMETTSSARRALEREPDERYAKLDRARSSMYYGEGLRMGLIKRFKIQFIQGAPEGWYYGMTMYYPDSIYGIDRAISSMRSAYQEGAPLPESTTEWYSKKYEDYIRALSGVR